MPSNAMPQGAPDRKIPHLIVVGGGFGGIALIKRLRKAEIRITLVDKHNYHTFQPLLYQVASGGLGADAIGYPFRLIFRKQKNLTFHFASVEEIKPQQRQIITNLETIEYDYLVLATGSTTNYFGNKELETWSMPLKSIPEALNLRSDILQEIESAANSSQVEEKARHMAFVVVGGGPTGVETAGSIAEFKRYVLPHDYPELDPSLMKVYLVEAGAKLLAGMSEKSGNNALRYLQEIGVEVMTGTAVSSFDGNVATLSTGEQINTGTLIWSAGVKGVILDGLPSSSIAGSRYVVDEFCRIKDVDGIFALGDAAGMFSAERPKGFPMVAPVAVQQGTLIAQNLKNSFTGKPLKPFRYNDKGSMATVGRNKAVVDLPFLSFGGFFAWLIWMFLHLMLLVGFRNRLVVFIDWMWSYFSYERALRLIIRKYSAPEKTE